jgi:hypothetical protein
VFIELHMMGAVAAMASLIGVGAQRSVNGRVGDDSWTPIVVVGRCANKHAGWDGGAI